MRSARYPSLVAGVARLAGLGESLSTESKAKIGDFLTTRVGQGWEWDFWPEWTPCELRAYRDAYANATAYPAPTIDAGTEVYFPAAQAYYQALRATTGNAPAILSGSTWTTNPAYWAECTAGYQGDDWATGIAYTAGTFVRNPADDRFYACHTAHTSGGSLDPTKFGILTPFERYVALDQTGKTPIAEVKGVYPSNPRLGQQRPTELPFKVTDRGIEPVNQALTGAQGWYWPWTGGGAYGANTIPTQVWVEFRKRPPEFSSVSFDDEATYFADDVAVNDGEDEDGECYKALVDSPGTDLTDETKWAKQLCPTILAAFAKRAAAADMLRPDAQHVNARAEDGPAFEFLLQAHDKVFAGQGQHDTAKAQTY